MDGQFRETTLRVVRQVRFTLSSRQETVELEIPVLYRRGALALDASRLAALAALKRRLEAHLRECEILERRGRELQAEWRELVLAATPAQALTNPLRPSPGVARGPTQGSDPPTLFFPFADAAAPAAPAPIFPGPGTLPSHPVVGGDRITREGPATPPRVAGPAPAGGSIP